MSRQPGQQRTMKALLKGPLSNTGVVILVLLGTLLTTLLVSELRPSCNVTDSQGWSQRFHVSVQSASTGSNNVQLQTETLYSSKDAAIYDALARYKLQQFKTNLLAATDAAIDQGDIGKLWKSVSPIIKCPADRPLTRYGGVPGIGDGAKLMCKLPQQLRQGSCVVYSLGSNGDYTFELDMLKESDCEVHTFDCTYANGTSQDPKRHFFHKWCIGDPRKGKQYRTWADITRSLGHVKVDVLKMDIEGHEYSVFATFKPEENLPAELAVELHAFRGAAQVTHALLHLAELGYAMYSQEVNQYAPGCCCEFTFMRFPPFCS